VLLETMLGKLKSFEVNEGRFKDLADEVSLTVPPPFSSTDMMVQ
jgi:hypothetical protein